ncbi:MAG: hypothetical protein ACHQNV_00045 [Vicinamibacteria bacterium]
MRSRLSLVVLLCLPLFVPPAGAAIIERVLAVVDGRPLLLSEALVLQTVKGIDQSAAVEALIDERLMFAEASRMPQSAVSAEEEEKALESLTSAAEDRAQRVSPAELRGLARRETAILKYVHFRFLPLVRIDEDAVRTAYDAEFGKEPGAPTFEEAAPQVRQRLVDKDLGQRIESWVKELRAAASIRYNP